MAKGLLMMRTTLRGNRPAAATSGAFGRNGDRLYGADL